MKYSAILAAALIFALSATQVNSQNLTVVPLEHGESVTPVTAVKVCVTVKKERVVPGPYARYAQKYLGAMPPLSERTTYTVTKASLSAGEYTAGAWSVPISEGIEVSSNVYDPTDFVRFAPDRMTAAEATAENMARDAANTIFTLRKRRFDLITGEAGENVYGEGMGAALAEMARMEEEYVSLFMGKTTVETTTEIFEIVPERGKSNYVVCRFSSEEGILPESDLSASPLVLMVVPDSRPADSAIPKADRKTGTLVRVAAWSDCTLTDGAVTLASGRFPLFQLGETVYGR